MFNLSIGLRIMIVKVSDKRVRGISQLVSYNRGLKKIGEDKQHEC